MSTETGYPSHHGHLVHLHQQQPQQYGPPIVQSHAVEIVKTQVTVANISTGSYPVVSAPPLAPDDYMTRAIIATFFCCWPVGCMAIAAASESRDAYSRGEFNTAEENSDKARRLSNISIGIGVVLYIILLIIIIATTS